MGTWPGGIGFARTITLPQDPSVPIVVFACEKDPTVPWSHQYHERLVGLDLALRHPGRDIHVFSHSVDGIASALHTLRHPDTLAVPSSVWPLTGDSNATHLVSVTASTCLEEEGKYWYPPDVTKGSLETLSAQAFRKFYENFLVIRAMKKFLGKFQKTGNVLWTCGL